MVTHTQSSQTTGLNPPASILPGLALVTAIGSAAYFLGTLHPSLDALALAIGFGIFARALTGENSRLLTGVRWALRVFIPAGIILYGTRLDFARLTALPPTVIVLTVLTMGAFYGAIYLLERYLPVARKTAPNERTSSVRAANASTTGARTALIASGSAICGASAIAVLAPVMDAEPEDTSVSLLVITAVGLLGAMVYPVLRELTGMSDILYAVLSGATLHQTGIVKIAITNLDPLYVSFALAVKTTRIVMLAIIAFIFGARHAFNPGTGAAARSRSPLQALTRVWFLVPFIAVGLAMSYLPGARGFFNLLSPAGTLIFSAALASIGLLVDIESVLMVGVRPLIVGFLGWVAVVIVFLMLSPLFI